MGAMIDRDLRLYFRNYSGVFFSLLGALISFVLYLLFLKRSMQSEWARVPQATQLLDTWLIGGTLAITGITTTLGGLSQLVIDREKHIGQDLRLTDAGPWRLQVSYLLSAGCIGILMQLAMLGIMWGYFHVTDQLVITGTQLAHVLGLIVVSSLLATVVNAIVVQSVQSLATLTKLASVIGTAAGFLVGTYIPIGVIPNAAQTLVKLTPGSYVAALYRQFLMTDRLKTAFKGNEDVQNHFEKLMGIRLEWSTLLSQSTTYHIIGLILSGALIIAFIPLGLKRWHQRRLMHSR